MNEQVLFGEFVERWLVEVAPIRYKPTAIAEYSSLLRLHLLPLFGQRVLCEISVGDVQRYLAEKVKAGLSSRSVRNHLVVLRSVLKAAVAYGLLESNVAMKAEPPRQFRKEQRFLPPDEMRRVLDATPIAWRCLIAMPIYTAARKGVELTRFR